MIDRAVLNQLEEVIDSFEMSWTPQSRDNIDELLETYELKHDISALTELIRIDIELRYKHGIAVRLEDYFSEFAGLLDDPASVAQIAFEDFRSRSARGDSISASRWESLPGVKSEIWFQQVVDERSPLRPDPMIRSQTTSCRSDPAFESELQAAGFQLVQSIGEGAFSRVYLATQQELARRYVVLKVVDQPLAEPQSMAMLQHTNIVPIYSFHRILSRSVICMPYWGAVTLNDFLKDKTTSDARGGESLVVTVRNRVRETTIRSAAEVSGDRPWPINGRPVNGQVPGAKPASLIPAADDTAVLRPLELIRSLGCSELAMWMFSRLAAALAHSHARGVLHGDLKPGNVLIRNDGEPALLDFNLSQSLDTKASQHVGGTLPYMAPETYRALMGQTVAPSGTSDIYSLGVMLFEFVTGRLPYPVPRSVAAIDLEPALSIRTRSPQWRDSDAVSPGLRSIIDRALAYAPEDRYQSADDLREDLECERMSHPLAHASEPRRARAAKWTRRHPRAMLSAAAVALAVALMLVGATAWRYRQDAIHMAAINHFEDFASHSATVLSTIMVDPQRHQEAGVLAAIKPLQDFGVLDGSGLADLQSPWMTLPQRDRVRDTLLRHVAQVAFAETDRLRPEAAQGPLDDAALRRLDRLIDAADRVRGQHPSRACEYLHAKRAALAGNVVRSDQHRRRAEAMGIEDQSEAYLDAVRLMSNRQWHLAREALTALADDPSIPSGLRWTMLGRSQYNDNKYEDAKISITQSIEHAPKASRLWFMRGLCYQQLSQHARAESDFGRAIDLEPTFAPAWAQRGLARLAQVRGKDEASFTSHEKYQSGIEDYTKSLALAPGNAQVLLMRARAYGHGGQDDLAQRDWEAAMNAENQSAPNLLRRAQARRETQPAQALADLERADKLDPDSRPVLSQMARILYARLHQYDRAMEVLDRLLSVYPNNEAALIDRSVLLARAGRHEEAIIDFKAAMAEPNSNRTLYQAACMQACMGQHVRAVSLLAKAIRAGYPATRASLEDDPDLDAIRHLPGFKAIQRTCYLGDLGERSGDNADGEIL